MRCFLCWCVFAVGWLAFILCLATLVVVSTLAFAKYVAVPLLSCLGLL